MAARAIEQIPLEAHRLQTQRHERNPETHHAQAKKEQSHNDRHTQARTPGFLRQHGVGGMTRSTEPETDADANKHSN